MKRTPVEFAGAVLSDYLGSVCLGIFCIGIIATSLPLFIDSVIAQRSIDTINSLKFGEYVTARQLDAALTAVGPVDPSDPAIGDRLINQGILTLTLALRLPDGEPRKSELLRSAIDLAETRLERAPVDTHTWARLAVAEYLLNGPTDLVFDALRQSFQTGPYEYYALKARLQLGHTLWSYLDDPLRDQTVTQAVMLWGVPADRVWLLRQYQQWPPDLQQRVFDALATRGQGQAFAERLIRFSD